MSRKLVEKTRALLQAEKGTVYKDHTNKLRFVLAFPNVYHIGMSTLGMQIVYRVLNGEPDVAAERVFLPDPDDLLEYERTAARLFALESQTPVDQFDVLAFSVSFELDYVHILEMLRLSGIPLRSKDRDETHPLVIAGGPAVTFNPEPLAEFLDAVVVGEAEDVVPEIVDVLRSFGAGSRPDLIRELAGISGVYVPAFYKPVYNDDGTVRAVEAVSGVPATVKRRLTEDLSKHDGASVITTPNCEFPDMTLTEAIRGCSRQCRFCVAGYTNLPPRPRLVREIEEGSGRLGLVGSAVFDHPEASEMCGSLLDLGREFSVSSIRIETLTSDLAEMMYRAGQRTITIAPEAGSERLRRVINKALTKEQIIEAVKMGGDAGFSRIKLYYMIGLPGEEESDVYEIAGLARELSSTFHKMSFQFSVSCYVPKPWTPFQWCGMEDEKSLSRKLSRLKKLFAEVRKARCTVESPRLAVVQALLARGDRRVSAYLQKASERDGSFARAAAEAEIDIHFYVNRVRAEGEVFPWDHIDLLVKKEYLRSELRKAFELKSTSACKVGACHRCGVC